MAIRLTVLGIVMAALVMVWTQPDLLEHCSLNFAALPECHEVEARQTQRRDAQERRVAIIQARMRAKEKVVHDLLGGRIVFLQAARQFKELNETPITCQDEYRPFYPGNSDGEKVCRQVLQWIEDDLEDLPLSQAQALRGKFEDELADNMRRNGGLVVLPE
jgi:hypothetical protein